jgi:hypothetical protein
MNLFPGVNPRLALKIMAGVIALSGLGLIGFVTSLSGAALWWNVGATVLSFVAAPLLWQAARPVAPSRAVAATTLAALAARTVAGLVSSVVAFHVGGVSLLFSIALSVVAAVYAVQCVLAVSKPAPAFGVE